MPASNALVLFSLAASWRYDPKPGKRKSRLPTVKVSAAIRKNQPPAQDEPGRDAGRNREHHQVPGGELGVLVVGLRERGEVCRAVDEHGNPEALLQLLAQPNVGQRQLHRAVRGGCRRPRGRYDAAGLRVDDPRHRDSDAANVRSVDALDHLLELVQQCRGIRALRRPDQRIAEHRVAQRRGGHPRRPNVHAYDDRAHERIFSRARCVPHR